MTDNDGSEIPATPHIGESKVKKQESSKLWLPVTAIAVVALTLLLLNLSESTLFPLSLKARDWTGFGGSTTEQATTSTELAPDGKIIKTVVTSKKEDGKTLWDWLSVLGVPLTLASLGFWFQSRQQTQADKKADLEKGIADQKADLEKKIADTASKEEVIQAYLDRLSDLLIDKNLIAIAAKIQIIEGKSAPKKEVSLTDPLREEKEQLDAAVDVIRARTLAVLRRLKDDPERKTSVMEFLLGAEVIQKLDLSLSGAELSGANLSGAELSGTYLDGANLSGANLSGAELKDAYLFSANLFSADLFGANLRDAYLRDAYLRGANLGKADLRDADLRDADLRDANLRDAQLSIAKLSGAQLSNANLSNADLTRADINRADLSYANLSGANLSGANLSGTYLTDAILLRADLRDADAEELTQQLLEGENSPLLCKVTLPKGIKVDPNRDCDKIPQALLDDFPEEFENLAKAQAFVDKHSKP